MMIAKREKLEGTFYFQSLKGHSYDSLTLLHFYIQQNYDIIEEFCNFWSLDLNLFIENLVIFIYLHDLGKLTEEFQENISQGRRSQKYPHAYYSFFLLNNIEFKHIFEDVPIELLAVLAHHTQLYSGIYSNHQNINNPTFLKEEINSFIENFSEIFNLFNDYFEFSELSFNENFNFKKVAISKKINKYNIKSNSFQNKFLLKSVFTYFFSILQLCDDFSSANFANFIKECSGQKNCFNAVLSNPQDYVLDVGTKDYINENIFCNIAPYSFQKELLNKTSKFSLLFAPCGRGKTEASLSWALKALKKYKKNKIVFAMPTQVTSNAMWERLCKIFGMENVALFHGKSFIKLKNLENSELIGDISSETFKGNVFFKPVTVTTIDHVIYSFVHGFNQADFALGNLQTSVIIFDEIHYYEETTLNHLCTLFDFLKEMNIPHILMSGTLPNFITRDLLDYDMTKDVEGLNFEPFSIEYNEECLIMKDSLNLDENIIEEIKSNYEKNLKQFFIFNTVDRSRNFYSLLKFYLPNCKIILYHSQFTHNHRVEKEKEILDYSSREGAFILIATQVIEISLDISADIMYTELAPPDALGQRGGRLNRKKKNGDFKMKIFNSESHLPYDEELINKTKETLKLGSVSYETFKIWCDEVYVERTLEKTILTKFFNDSVLFGNKSSDVAFNEDKANKLEIRKESIQKVDVIPLDIYKNDENNLTVENQVKIPLWWIQKDERENSQESRCFSNAYKKIGKYEKSFIICSFDYSYESGFNRDKKSSFGEEESLL